MSSYVFVICIVAIAVGGGVLTTYLKQNKNQPKDNQEFDEAIAKIDELEERIRVLERIITENKYDLKREIVNL